MHREERGTVAVVMALMMTALLGMLALVVDVGYGYSQHRFAQNVADSAALAGAKIVAAQLRNGGKTDSDVLAAINEVVTNSPGGFASAYTAYYVTDTNQDGVFELTTTRVGSLGNVAPPSAARGVKVIPAKNNSAFFAPALGTNTLLASASSVAFTQPIIGYSNVVPYAIWGGESWNKCNNPTGSQGQGGGGAKVSGNPPANPPTGDYGCYLEGHTMTYRSPQWQRENVLTGDTSANPNWWGNSNNFKGYFHDGNSSVLMTVNVNDTVSDQGGLAGGTASAVDAVIQHCYDLTQQTPPVSCTVTMPIIDFETGNGNLTFRIAGFAEVVPTNNPSSNNTWYGYIKAATSYGAIVGTSCTNAANCQYAVKLAQ